MACSSARVPLFNALAKRNFAAAAASPSLKTSEIESTTLPNKLVVCSSPGYNPGLAKIAVALKAGSRYESGETQGASHLLRATAGLTTCSHSQFAIVRNLQQLGASLSTTTDRETIVYTLEATCDNIEKASEVLRSIVCDQVFKPWELSDIAPRVQYDLATIPLRAKLLDNLHKAAFRRGLGNSIFVKGHNIKNLNSETLLHYVSSTFKASRCCVAAVGVSNATAMEFARSLELNADEGAPSKPSKFYSSEVRKEVSSNLVHVAVAGEAPGLTKKEVFAYGVLRCALGGLPSIKWGMGSDPLSQALSNTVGSSAQALHIAHSDAGLFGVVVSATPDNIKHAVETAMQVLKKDVSEEAVNRGKAQLKNALLFDSERSGRLVSEMGSQALILGACKSPDQIAKEVDQVTVSQVKSAQAKIAAGKMAMAAVGPLDNVPHLDEL